MNDKIRPEVIGALHYIREAIKSDGIDPILRGALALMDKTGVFDEIDKARDEAPAAGRHRRSLGTGGALPAGRGEMLSSLTIQPEGVPPTDRFDVDLVYTYRRANGTWTEAKTWQDTLFAEDEEKALVIAQERLLRMLRRAGYVTHADHLKIVSGSTSTAV